MLTSDINSQSLKLLAYVFKLFAIFVSVMPLWFFPIAWGTNPVGAAQTVGLAILSVVPNRWFVFSRTSFAISLLLAVFPFRTLFSFAHKGAPWGIIVGGVLVGLILFLPLPVSFVLSRARFQRGEKFIYA